VKEIAQMQIQRSYASMLRAGWVSFTLFLGVGALWLYDWYFRYFTESARFLLPNILLLLAIISVVVHYKTRHPEQLQPVYGTISLWGGFGLLGISWLGHWSAIIVTTTILRGESGEVVNLTNYDLAFYADRYSAFLALLLFMSALLAFLLSTKDVQPAPLPWLLPLALTVIMLNLWLLAHIDDATAFDARVALVVWLLYIVAWSSVGMMGYRWFASSQTLHAETHRRIQ
jgi:hypothetical protein